MLWGKDGVPDAVGGVAFALDDGIAIFACLDVVFGKESDTVFITELANRGDGPDLRLSKGGQF